MRNWQPCADYKFLSAGQGIKYSSPTFQLEPNDIVAAYITDVGYVGIGEVQKHSIQIIDFRYKGKSLRGLPGISDYLFDNSERDNPKSEYCVEINWTIANCRDNPLWINQGAYGYYAARNTVTRIDRKKHADTIDVLEKFFKVLFIYH